MEDGPIERDQKGTTVCCVEHFGKEKQDFMGFLLINGSFIAPNNPKHVCPKQAWFTRNSMAFCGCSHGSWLSINTWPIPQLHGLHGSGHRCFTETNRRVEGTLGQCIPAGNSM